MWFEDPVRVDNLDTLLQFRQSTPCRPQPARLCPPGFSRGARKTRRVDCHARRRLAGWRLAIAAYDCVGPITLMASVHLDYAVPNVYIQEVVRAYLQGVYPNLVTTVPHVDQGTIRPPEAHGLGTQLLPDLKHRADATVRITSAP
jgi:L-alanine-DL-glutamate epimerase-like enolase superfamily enzyme